MRVLAIQNTGCEPLGYLEQAWIAQDHNIDYLRAYDGDPLPDDLSDWDAAVILGGPMSVYDENPTIAAEVRMAKRAIDDDLPLLGICLGSQVIAAAAGARVYPGSVREAGWSHVSLKPAVAEDSLMSGLSSPLAVFQLHGDTFELPVGAELLAGSDAYENQAFRMGNNVYGVQFHLEVTPHLVQEWWEEYSEYIEGAGVSRAEILAHLEERCEALVPAASEVAVRFPELASQGGIVEQ